MGGNGILYIIKNIELLVAYVYVFWIRNTSAIRCAIFYILQKFVSLQLSTNRCVTANSGMSVCQSLKISIIFSNLQYGSDRDLQMPMTLSKLLV
jgi:hypothetical protein